MSTYVYAITGADHPLRLDDLQGVGDPPSPLRAVTSGPVAAVVSDAPPGLRAKRRDVVAHESVLEALMADGATLPMRFGLLGPDDERVAEVLGRDAPAYQERLTELDGHVEYHLKAARDEKDMLLEIMEGSEQARELNRRTRTDPGAHDERIALGELVAREVAARGEAQAEETTKRLSPAAARLSRSEAGATHFLNVSFLVPTASTDSFLKAVREEAERLGEGYNFTLTGPLPPYSFV
ncbi:MULTISPECIES: GvpL/GvpF family gas vesicle protein [Streptomyces]|uniref:GvpL/GvpF family gas vesicle protein n=1 Tax=Streptomyces lateritius TaxID=67313 RepID=A0ABW6YJB3_9ACTN|nr:MULTISPECIES: GvpL/GvpF family gas vesicle protein [Streptomyces]QGZ52352.1 gas vesicle protein [Streptomyces sp. QHH-9511]GGT85858.1 gas vesicle protein [Streptomyces lateritius]